MILQSEAAECGLACLAMVAAHHGQRLTLSELRRKVVISLKGTTLKSLMAIADSLGFSTRPLRVELDALNQVKTPAILHWDMAHYVVLIRVTARHVEINDPALGTRRLTWGQVSKHFTGVVLELTPAPGFQKKTHVDKVRLSDLWTRASGFVPSIVQLLVLSLVLQIFTLLAPMLNQMVIDDAVTKGDMDLLGILILGMALLALAQMGTTLLRGFVGMHFGTHLNFQMRGNLLRHLLRLPVPWFEKRSLGDILSRFGSLEPVQSLFTGGLIAVVLDGMMAVVTLAVMLLYAPALTGLVLAGLALYFVIRAASYPFQRRMADEGIQLSAKENSVFLETVRGARAFKLFGREAERHSLWQNAWADSINNGLRMQKFGLIGGTANGLFDLSINLLVLYLGARMVYSPADALRIARAHPTREVVFLAIGFETTTPPTALVIQQAAREALGNFSVLCCHVLTPAAIAHIVSQPVSAPPAPAAESDAAPVRLDGFVGPAHVSIVIGSAPYEPFAATFGKPVVISGFEPLDMMQSILMLLQQVNAGRAVVENQFTRAVSRQGNLAAQAVMADVFEQRPSFEWRGLGEVAASALRIRDHYAAFDAEQRFGLCYRPVPDHKQCDCGAILRGVKRPEDCKLFATVCTPENPMGSCMVSSEGACAAHYTYGRFRTFPLQATS